MEAPANGARLGNAYCKGTVIAAKRVVLKAIRLTT